MGFYFQFLISRIASERIFAMGKVCSWILKLEVAAGLRIALMEVLSMILKLRFA